MNGYHGRYLRVDLATGGSVPVPIPEAVLRRYLGGVGLGTWILFREAPAGVDPLSAEAPLVFCFSPLVGTPFTTSAKFAVVAKSPLTGLVCDSLSSSHFAIDGKHSGYDALVFVGACAEPSVWIRGALSRTALWGCSPAQTEQALAGEGRVASIGVAGENGVLFATISNEGRHAGRGGLGAVMGAKQLKAVVVRGERPAALAHPQAVGALARDLAQRARGEATEKYRELGTAGNLLAFERLGALPTRNFRGERVDGVARLAPETLQPERQTARRSCAACNIGCEHVYRMSGDRSVRVEYESLFALGPLCGITDPDAVLEASRRCDELGLDTISCGGTLAFAMECSERGWLPGAPRFGDAAGALSLIDDIGGRAAGLGDLLADGSRRAALAVGHGSLDFAPQVKGLELPGYEPRALQTMALGLAVGTRGADHNRSGAYELDFSTEVDRRRGDARAARLAVEPELRAALMDSLILCKFVRHAIDDLFEEAAGMLHDVVGWDVDASELRRAARRIADLKKAFNVREGWTPDDDTLPRRLLEEALPQGAGRGCGISRDRLAAMIRAYNLERGWTSDGYPTRAILDELAVDVPIEAGTPVAPERTSVVVESVDASRSGLAEVRGLLGHRT